MWGGKLEQFYRFLPILEKRQFPPEKLIIHKYPLSKLSGIMKAPERGHILDGKESLKIVVSGELK